MYDKTTMGDLDPELSLEEQQRAAENLLQYLQIVKRIYDELKANGKWDEVKLRIDYDKRNRKSAASQNVDQDNEISSTTTKDSNLFPHD